MKKYILILVALVFASLAWSQDHGRTKPAGEQSGVKQEEAAARRAAARDRQQQRREQIAAQKAAYITGRVGMTREEAEKFWPVYNQCQADLEKVKKEFREKNTRTPGVERTEAEIKEMMDQRFRMQEEKLKIEMRYHKEYLKLLGARNVEKLYRAEDDFKKEILREIKNRGGSRALKKP
jgi:hypothetical protein